MAKTSTHGAQVGGIDLFLQQCERGKEEGGNREEARRWETRRGRIDGGWREGGKEDGGMEGWRKEGGWRDGEMEGYSDGNMEKRREMTTEGERGLEVAENFSNIPLAVVRLS
jgi:hypothetical protein